MNQNKLARSGPTPERERKIERSKLERSNKVFKYIFGNICHQMDTSQVIGSGNYKYNSMQIQSNPSPQS